MTRHSLDYYLSGIAASNKIVLSRAITLLESSLVKDREFAAHLIDQLDEKTESIRIGVSGVPGVGKSTFIEAFGTYLTEKGHKIAVLAVDPSSQKTGGSILGDKTRMETLSRNPSAFIRPSPSKLTLGGVGDSTRESILLCEAAGYDVIIIETVGVGQSETTVHGMVDFFLLMMLAGAGDELQGIKKGIMEIADGVIINKTDGDNIKNAHNARGAYKNALHLFAPNESGWQPDVLTCSSLEKTGLEDIWKMIKTYQLEMSQNGFFEKNRINQNMTWFKERLHKLILNRVEEHKDFQCQLKKSQTDIEKGMVTPNLAIKELIETLFPMKE